MVPFASSTPVSEIIFTVVGDSVYIAIGSAHRVRPRN
jgi:hypothetical protein